MLDIPLYVFAQSLQTVTCITRAKARNTAVVPTYHLYFLGFKFSLYESYLSELTPNGLFDLELYANYSSMMSKGYEDASNAVL